MELDVGRLGHVPTEVVCELSAGSPAERVAIDRGNVKGLIFAPLRACDSCIGVMKMAVNHRSLSSRTVLQHFSGRGDKRLETTRSP